MSKDAKKDSRCTIRPAELRQRRARGVSRVDRLERGEFQRVVASKKCLNCTAVGRWERYCTKGRIRYIRCEVCGYCDHVAVISPPATNPKLTIDPPQAGQLSKELSHEKDATEAQT
ncbi:MAG TPA: hypothetical protein VNA25_25475 [Phycisphaerae bacterium]|nr:hypothetical protein [Phycisphaerae bacterium]HUT61214.1 hypothetical protein [Phycisphaerae bacterium]